MNARGFIERINRRKDKALALASQMGERYAKLLKGDVSVLSGGRGDAVQKEFIQCETALNDEIFLFEHYLLGLSQLSSQQSMKEREDAIADAKLILGKLYAGIIYADANQLLFDVGAITRKLADQYQSRLENARQSGDQDLLEAAMTIKLGACADQGVKITDQDFEEAIKMGPAYVGQALLAGYAFNEMVLGYLMSEISENGCQTIDYLLENNFLNEENLLKFQNGIEECTDLMFAVILGDQDVVKRILDGFDVPRTSDQRHDLDDALVMAVNITRADMVHFLLDAGADVNCCYSKPFVVALETGQQQLATDLLRRDDFSPWGQLLQEEKDVYQLVMHKGAPEMKAIVTQKKAKRDIDAFIEKMNDKISSLKNNAENSWVVDVGNQTKADNLQSALDRAIASDEAQQSLTAFYGHKDGDLQSIAEVLGGRRIGFFTPVYKTETDRYVKEQEQQYRLV